MLVKSIREMSTSQSSNVISIGIDQGTNLWAMGVTDWETLKYSSFIFQGELKEIECYRKILEYKNSGKKVSVCYEAGRFGFTPARTISNLGCTVRVLPVNKIEIIQSGKKAKTDKLDARFLSELNPLDQRIPSVWVPSVQEEALRGLPRELKRIKKDISRNNNRIISILERWPIPKVNTHLSSTDWLKKISTWKGLNFIPNLIPISELQRIKYMVKEIELFEQHLRDWEKVIKNTEEKEIAKSRDNGKEHVIDKLRKYRGIGEVIGRSFAWEVGNFERFKNGKCFSSYIGLTPTPYSSGNKQKEQGISKQGNSELRRLAIQLSWLWKYWQPNSRITLKWQEQLNKKGRQRKTAIVAMGRQLMIALYRDIIYGEEIDGAVINDETRIMKKLPASHLSAPRACQT